MNSHCTIAKIIKTIARRRTSGRIAIGNIHNYVESGGYYATDTLSTQCNKKSPAIAGLFFFIPSLCFSQKEKKKDIKNYLASSAFGFSRKRIPKSRN